MMAGVRHAATLDCWDHSLEQLLPSALRGKDSSEEIAQSEAERVVLVLGLDVVELGVLAHEETVVERHAEVIGDAIADSGAELPGAHRIALVGEVEANNRDVVRLDPHGADAAAEVGREATVAALQVHPDVAHAGQRADVAAGVQAAAEKIDLIEVVLAIGDLAFDLELQALLPPDPLAQRPRGPVPPREP